MELKTFNQNKKSSKCCRKEVFFMEVLHQGLPMNDKSEVLHLSGKSFVGLVGEILKMVMVWMQQRRRRKRQEKEETTICFRATSIPKKGNSRRFSIPEMIYFQNISFLNIKKWKGFIAFHFYS